MRKGATVAKLAAELKAAATEKRPVLADLAQALQPRASFRRADGGAATDHVTLGADAARRFGRGGDALATVMSLAGAELATSEAAVSAVLVPQPTCARQ